MYGRYLINRPFVLLELYVSYYFERRVLQKYELYSVLMLTIRYTYSKASCGLFSVGIYYFTQSLFVSSIKHPS